MNATCSKKAKTHWICLGLLLKRLAMAGSPSRSGMRLLNSRGCWRHLPIIEDARCTEFLVRLDVVNFCVIMGYRNVATLARTSVIRLHVDPRAVVSDRLVGWCANSDRARRVGSCSGGARRSRCGAECGAPVFFPRSAGCPNPAVRPFPNKRTLFPQCSPAEAMTADAFGRCHLNL